MICRSSIGQFVGSLPRADCQPAAAIPEVQKVEKYSREIDIRCNETLREIVVLSPSHPTMHRCCGYRAMYLTNTCKRPPSTVSTSSTAATNRRSSSPFLSATSSFQILHNAASIQFGVKLRSYFTKAEHDYRRARTVDSTTASELLTPLRPHLKRRRRAHSGGGKEISRTTRAFAKLEYGRDFGIRQRQNRGATSRSSTVETAPRQAVGHHAALLHELRNSNYDLPEVRLGHDRRCPRRSRSVNAPSATRSVAASKAVDPHPVRSAT